MTKRVNPFDESHFDGDMEEAKQQVLSSLRKAGTPVEVFQNIQQLLEQGKNLDEAIRDAGAWHYLKEVDKKFMKDYLSILNG